MNRNLMAPCGVYIATRDRNETFEKMVTSIESGSPELDWVPDQVRHDG
ncbi:MAG: hypothetical protein PHY29_03620 [Syntrophales bacterium]|nr:hypothetical protein [Syntrophales bacterium]